MATRTDRAPRQRLDVNQRREAILSAARQLYATHSWADVAVGQIAEAAQASPALVFHYFGSKAQLYAAVIAEQITALDIARQQADQQLAARWARERVRAWLGVQLDHLQAHQITAGTWLRGGEEPPEAVAVRREGRSADIATLQEILQPTGGVRHDYALIGYFGFLDQASLHWLEAGCPPQQRHPLIEACLGALEGALGDWGR